MHLTNISLGIIKQGRKFPKGNIYAGKYRLVKPVTHLNKAIQLEKFKIEEKNMFLLRHSYLTPEEEKGYSDDFKHHEKWLENKIKEKNMKFIKHKKLTDHFCDLRSNENWD